jgi:hypothetical protein
MSYRLEIWYLVHKYDKERLVEIGAAVGGILTAFGQIPTVFLAVFS